MRPHWAGLSMGLAAVMACTPAVADEARVQACIAHGAAQFDVDPLVLQILREVEGGVEGTESRNTNDTTDLGPMQINSSWLPQLGRVGVTWEALRDDACVNALVAAWIFKQEWRATGNIAMAIARYHSPTPEFQARYLARALDVVRRHRTELDAVSADAATAAQTSLEVVK